jgi:hypothetical protein
MVAIEGGVSMKHIISLGAGVQSSVMALMAAKGEFQPMPDAAIFADTQAEPASVYRWLDWLEKQLPFPVVRVTAGDIVATITTPRRKKDGSGWWVQSNIPAFVRNADGSDGMVQRQCTETFKIEPIRKAVRKLADIKRGEKTVQVTQWIGISLDEIHRMKVSLEKWQLNRWPLVEAGMKRHDCLRWMERNGYPPPPRSSCVFCPYHSNREWRRLRDEEPKEFARAVEVEKLYQSAKDKGRIHGQFFLHAQRVPLSEVELDEPRGQGWFWGHECDGGSCGL